MANLIITIIAIALVAVAALMGAYYGGKAFLQGRVKAYANTLASQGQQIVAAWQLYATNNGGSFQIANISALAPTYLSAVPTVPEDIRFNWASIGGSGLSNWQLDNLDGAFTDGTTNPSTSAYTGVFVRLSGADQFGVDVCNQVAIMAGGPTATPTAIDASSGTNVDLLTTSKKFDCVYYSYEGNPTVGIGDDIYVYFAAR